jgi:hypothetical protein
MEESVQKKKKAEKVYLYLRHNKLKNANLDLVFSESRSGTIAHKNKKRITAVTQCSVKNLFRIPHMPPAGSLKVLRAPARWGGIRCALQTKIYNLETDEFVSNPPFSK